MENTKVIPGDRKVGAGQEQVLEQEWPVQLVSMFVCSVRVGGDPSGA